MLFRSFVERDFANAAFDGGASLLAAANAVVTNIQAGTAADSKLFGLFGGSGGYFEQPVPSDDGSAGFTVNCKPRTTQ